MDKNNKKEVHIVLRFVGIFFVFLGILGLLLPIIPGIPLLIMGFPILGIESITTGWIINRFPKKIQNTIRSSFKSKNKDD